MGYRSVEQPTADQFEYAAGARRFEVGSANPTPHVALREAIQAVESVGIETIESRIGQLAARLAEGIPEPRLLGPAQPKTGLVAIGVAEPETTVERLAADGIVVRALPPVDAVRVSVHAVNTESEVDHLLASLEPEW